MRHTCKARVQDYSLWAIIDFHIMGNGFMEDLLSSFQHVIQQGTYPQALWVCNLSLSHSVYDVQDANIH